MSTIFYSFFTNFFAVEPEKLKITLATIENIFNSFPPV